MLNGAKHSPLASADSCPEGGNQGVSPGYMTTCMICLCQTKSNENFATAASGYAMGADSKSTIDFALGGRLIVIQTRFRARSVSKR